ncbi:Conjugal transfer protein TraG [Jannaschia rubra]|uniref:Conjugal transfer protein TraG n=1 Tax=Jannaschia rubra TaxID=282197 RepID=A0A0M6XV11_9RHOB|nr:Conjugal transfer protein TraG [Jannaschia rubra]
MDKGKIAVGVVLLTLVFAAMGYVAATAYLTFRDYGIRAEIDFSWVARSYLDWRIIRPDDFQMVNLIVGGFTAVGLLASAALSGQALTRFGQTRFQKAAELKRNGFMGKPGTGFALGKIRGAKGKAQLLSSKVFPHALVVAPTGRGKTSGFAIPNLLLWKGSTVALDVKGELFTETSRHRAAHGDAVFRFAPTDWADRRSHRYNPLLRIYQLDDPEQQQMELQLLATLFLQSENDKVKGLLEGGIELFVAAGLLAFERKKPTLGEIYRIASDGGDKQKAYFNLSTKVENEAAKRIFVRLASTNNDTLTSYLSLLMTSGLNQWSNPAIDRATEVSDFDFRDIRKKPMSVYLVVAPNMVKPLAALIRLFFSDLIASIQTKEPGEGEPWPVMILLDEFNRLGKMPIVVESIETLRSYRGHLAVITQTIPALDEIYGENTRRALQGNAGVKLYLTPSDEKTVEELSKAVGKTTKRVVTRSRSIGRNPFEGRSMSERTEEVALLTEDDARRMPLDDIIVVVDAQMPIRAKRIQYYDDPMFRKIHGAQKGELPLPLVNLARKGEDGDDKDIGAGKPSEGGGPTQEPALAAKAEPAERGANSAPITSTDAPMPGEEDAPRPSAEPEPMPAPAPGAPSTPAAAEPVPIATATVSAGGGAVRINSRRAKQGTKTIAAARDGGQREMDLAVQQNLDLRQIAASADAEAVVAKGIADFTKLEAILTERQGRKEGIETTRPRPRVVKENPEFIDRQRQVLDARRAEGMNMIVLGEDGRILKIAPDGTETDVTAELDREVESAGGMKA